MVQQQNTLSTMKKLAQCCARNSRQTTAAIQLDDRPAGCITHKQLCSNSKTHFDTMHSFFITQKLAHVSM